MAELLIDRRADGVSLLTVNRAYRANALDDGLLFEDLPLAVLGLVADPGTRVIVITGAGAHFCSGADLDSRAFRESDSAHVAEWVRKAHRTVQVLRGAGKPSIAAVTGAAVGAGLGLALACDLTICSPDAEFRAPFSRIGLAPDYGCSYLLPEAVGKSLAIDMFLTGRRLSAQEALASGLACRVSDDPKTTALEVAASLTESTPLALSLARNAVYERTEPELSRSLMQAEPRAVAQALSDGAGAGRIERYKTAVAEGHS